MYENEGPTGSFLGFVEGFPDILAPAATIEQAERDWTDSLAEHLSRWRIMVRRGRNCVTFPPFAWFLSAFWVRWGRHDGFSPAPFTPDQLTAESSSVHLRCPPDSCLTTSTHESLAGPDMRLLHAIFLQPNARRSPPRRSYFSRSRPTSRSARSTPTSRMECALRT